MIELHFNSAASVTGWTPIDDRVMGGVSSSQLVFHQDGYAVFAGQVSSDHGGGLASVRHCDLALGDESTVGYRLQVRGDGKRYKFNLRMDAVLDGSELPGHFPATRWAVGRYRAALGGVQCPLPG